MDLGVHTRSGSAITCIQRQKIISNPYRIKCIPRKTKHETSFIKPDPVLCVQEVLFIFIEHLIVLLGNPVANGIILATLIALFKVLSSTYTHVCP